MSRKGKPIVKRRTEVAKHVPLEVSIEQALQYFVELKKTEGVRERTVKDYYNISDYFFRWLREYDPSIVNISDINTEIIRKYILYLREDHYNVKTGGLGLSPFTINVRIRFLKAFFNTLTDEGMINTNPATNIKLMRVDDDTFEPLTDAEIDRLLAAPNPEEYAQFRDLVMMYLILDTGARISEVCNLEVEDIDFKTRCIVLPAHKNKNRKPRILPLSNKTLRLLLELVTENKVHFDTRYVFLANCGTKYNPNSYRKRLHIYRDKAGIKKRVSPHALRHHFCQTFIKSGGDVFTLARIVGHADISTTRKYMQMSDETLKEQHAQFTPILRIRNRR